MLLIVKKLSPILSYKISLVEAILKIAIFGMGYVGITTAACLCELGNIIIGIEINKDKVDIINSGKSPIMEKGLEELIEKHVKNKRLVGTTDHLKAISESEIALICVGTPSNKNGSLDLSHIKNVTKEIGFALKDKEDYTIIYRSTMLPGSMENIVIPILEKESGKKAGIDFKIYYNPEFLREGTAIEDFFNPPKTVIGTLKNQSAKLPEKLYEKIDAPLFITTIKEAEMVKYVDNIFHALKISFANEIGRISKEIGIDSRKIMEIFTSDTRLNISPYYLKPGFAFGGSCLPKDLRAINDFSKKNDIEIPIISNILISNQKHIEFLIDKVISTQKKKIGIVGIAFKNGTDDLRESPILDVIETLLGKGYDVKIYDKYINLSRLIGKNREYLFKKLPHIMKLLCDNLEEVILNSDVILLVNKNEDYINSILTSGKGKILFDLCDGLSKNQRDNFLYEGICW